MGKAHGTKAKPQFTTDDGVTLDLRIIRSLVIDRFNIEWSKQHPKPMPPYQQLANGDNWADVNDPWYKQQLSDWGGEQQRAIAEFMFSHGVLTEPPPDWQPILAVNGNAPRYVWLTEILSEDDISDLIEAIGGVDNATPGGIDEAEKKSPPLIEAAP